LNGSIFNNYNATTDVAEIIRSLVGIISASNPSLVASPQPNAVVHGTPTAEGENVPSTVGTNTTSTWTNAFVPSVAFGPPHVAPIRYLQSKGFNSNGTQVFKPLHFAGTTIYNVLDNAYGIQLDDSVAGTGYFDAGAAGQGARLFIIATQSFSDNPTVTTPTETSTFTTRSLVMYTSTTDTSPLWVRDRASGTPSVIPPAYQEARYEDVPIITSRKYNAVKSDFGSVASTAAAISSSGYYRYHGIKAGFASSSGASITQVIGGSLTTLAPQSTFFITPLATGQIVSLRAQSPSVVRELGLGVDMTPIAATSRSLSGAPYLNGSQWLNTQAHLIRGMFNPLYYAVSSSANVVVAEISASSTVTPLTASGDWQFLLNNGRRASTKSNMVWLGTSNVPNVGDPPYSGTTASLAGSTIIGFGPNYIANRPTYTGLTNMVEGNPTPTTWTVQPKYKAWNGAGTFNSSLSSTSYNFHTPGTLGQPASSGSLAVWISRNGQSDFTGEGLLTTRFRDETRRKQINGLTVADAIASTWNSGSRLKSGEGGDLQYKPGANSYGWLVNPEHGANSTDANSSAGYGYWYPTGSYNNSHYKWALHKFDFNLDQGGFKSSITITTHGDNDFSNLVSWNDTTGDRYAIGIIFSQQLSKVGPTFDRPRVYDVSGTGTFEPNLDNRTANAAGDNPFNQAIDIKKQWTTRTANTSAGIITLGLSAGVGQELSNPDGEENYSDVYVLVRYKGAPSDTLQQIALS